MDRYGKKRLWSRWALLDGGENNGDTELGSKRASRQSVRNLNVSLALDIDSLVDS